MPIRIKKLNGNKALELFLSGSVEKIDYRETIPILEDAIAQHGKISLLVNLCLMEHWKPNTIWEELKFDVKHFRHFSRIAMVGSEKWEEWLTKASAYFIPAEIRYYDCSASEAAESWLLDEDLPLNTKGGVIGKRKGIELDDVLWKQYTSRIELESEIDRSSRRRASDLFREDYLHLEHRVEKLSLICRALWEFINQQHGLTEEDLLKRVKEIDARDGSVDGHIEAKVFPCKKCGHNVNSRHPACVYCGYRDPKADLFAQV